MLRPIAIALILVLSVGIMLPFANSAHGVRQTVQVGQRRHHRYRSRGASAACFTASFWERFSTRSWSSPSRSFCPSCGGRGGPPVQGYSKYKRTYVIDNVA